jgi:hypothetical protein
MLRTTGYELNNGARAAIKTGECTEDNFEAGISLQSKCSLKNTIRSTTSPREYLSVRHANRFLQRPFERSSFEPEAVPSAAANSILAVSDPRPKQHNPILAIERAEA